MGELVPWGKVWRTGANQATTLTTNFDMLLGEIPLMKGKYSLWTIPSPAGWKLIVNKQTGQWGTDYDEEQDYARFDATVTELPAEVETLTVALQQTGPSSGLLKLSWERTLVSTPFEKSSAIRPVSPTDSLWVALGDAGVKIKYGRPSMRGRTLWGVVVPYDSVWRTGANSATVLDCQADILLNETRIPKGVYTLYSIPRESSLILIVSKKGPGRAQYDVSQDFVRVEMMGEKSEAMIDPFTIWSGSEGSDRTTLNIGWGNRKYSAEIGAAK
jgi:hypothetical protein